MSKKMDESEGKKKGRKAGETMTGKKNKNDRGVPTPDFVMEAEATFSALAIPKSEITTLLEGSINKTFDGLMSR